MNLEVETTYTLTLDSKEAYLLKSLAQCSPEGCSSDMLDFCEKLFNSIKKESN